MMNTAYRSSYSAARVDARTERLVGIVRARFGRIAGGIVLTCGGIIALLGALLTMLSGAPQALDGIPIVVWILLGAWPAAIAAALVVRTAVAVARVGADESPAALERRLYALETHSFAWPLIGLSFVAPLSVHALLPMLGGDLGGFAAWMGISAALVGHAHIALATAGALFARDLHRAPSDAVPSWKRAVVRSTVLAVGLSAVPGALLYLIPPILTLVTGATFVPLAYWLTHRCFVGERADVAAALHATVHA